MRNWKDFPHDFLGFCVSQGYNELDTDYRFYYHSRVDSLIEIKEWEITEDDTVNLTPSKVRDLIIQCFTYAHFEEVLEKKKGLITHTDFDVVRNCLIAEIKVTFNQANENFENPTKQGLLKVINILAKKQINRGGNSFIIENHRTKLYSVISKLK